MSSTKKNQAPVYNSKAEKWEAVAAIMDELQHQVDTKDLSTKDLIHLIAQSFPENFPCPSAILSIIYQDYVTHELRVLVNAGEKSDILLKQSTLATGENAIQQTINGEPVVLEINPVNCEQLGFSGADNVLIAPMRLNPKGKNRNDENPNIIGAFVIIVPNCSGHCLNEDDLDIIDRLSDRTAFLIKYSDLKARPKISDAIHTNIISKIGEYKSETEIFQDILNSLTGTDELNLQWFSSEEINILLYHPFQKNRFYVVCENGKIDDEFRSSLGCPVSDLAHILGENPDQFSKMTETRVFDSSKQINEANLPDKYQSYAITPILIHARNNIGLIILRNKNKDKAYHDERYLLKRVADDAALALRSFRHDAREEHLEYLRINFIDNNKIFTDSELYFKCLEIIEKIYGSAYFSVVGLHVEDRIPYISYPNSNINFSEIEDDIINSITQNNIEPHTSTDQQYYLIPITAESGRITNFFILKINRPVGRTLQGFLVKLASLVGHKQSLQRKKQRLEALTEFGDAITETTNHDIDYAYELVYNHTHKVMSTTNMYIARLDKKNNVSFPLFRQKNIITQEIENRAIPKRFFDPDAKKLPRTEYILKTKETILIDTEKQSIEWYDSHGGSEMINDYFSSWVGVPIVNDNKAIGVIAVYHPTANFLYTEADVMFLKNIAVNISKLLVQTELEESNRKLEESIANNENLTLEGQSKEEETLIKNRILTKVQKSTRDSTYDIKKSADYTIQDIEALQVRIGSKYLNDAIIMQNEIKNTAERIDQSIVKMVDIDAENKLQIFPLLDQILKEESNSLIEFIKIQSDNTDTSIELIGSSDDCFIAIASLTNCIRIILEKNQIDHQKGYYCYFNSDSQIGLSITIENENIEVTYDTLEKHMRIPKKISSKRLNANLDFELISPKSLKIDWKLPKISKNRKKPKILIIGGIVATRRDLEKTVTSLGYQFELSDHLIEGDFLCAIFLDDTYLSTPPAKNSNLKKFIVAASITPNSSYISINKKKLNDIEYMKSILQKN